MSTASVDLSRWLGVTSYLSEHIDLEACAREHSALVRLLLLDRVTSMVDEEIDIAVRIGNPPDSALHMVKIGEVRRVFGASPAYVEQHGAPLKLPDLRDHTLIDIEDERGNPGEWQAPKVKGSRSLARRLSVNSIDAAISAAVAGLGIVRTLSYQSAGHFADGSLVPVVTAEPAPAIPVSLPFQSGARNTPNIRAFLKQARERFVLNGTGMLR